MISLLLLGMYACHTQNRENEKIDVIFDTDTNNELDDQHALAYLLFNDEIFDVKGVTVNATIGGGNIDNHYAEARRVMQLCNRFGKIPLLKGADKNFYNILPTLNTENHDGAQAVDFIIRQALESKKTLTVLAVGKLTNVALALRKNPGIATKIRIVWLGSNYPAGGEYNLVNDTEAANYVLQSVAPFEMVTVRFRNTSG
ncbi:MAG: nucleoside hydrolase, partial [Prolixibacteraceae bacterium]|nr:nucleoside hydrolase [Prolixibacteraceae bacterium]